jgi:hypothetical protein
VVVARWRPPPPRYPNLFFEKVMTCPVEKPASHEILNFGFEILSVFFELVKNTPQKWAPLNDF